jgi:hypothetical protein
MIKAEDLRNTWRIIVAVVIGQLTGLAIGFLAKLHPELFLSIWTGGAIGTLPGFIIGLFWHFGERRRRKQVPYFTVGFFALGSIIFSITAFQLLIGGIGSVNLVTSLQSLSPSAISTLTIYKGYDQSNTITITDREQISSFIEACSDLKDDYIQHNSTCNRTAEYFIGLNGSLPKDLILEYCQSNVVKGVFAIREGKTTTFHGTFSSVKLKEWLTNNVVLTL